MGPEATQKNMSWGLRSICHEKLWAEDVGLYLYKRMTDRGHPLSWCIDKTKSLVKDDRKPYDKSEERQT